jgi:hypothetical protein
VTSVTTANDFSPLAGGCFSPFNAVHIPAAAKYQGVITRKIAASPRIAGMPGFQQFLSYFKYLKFDNNYSY